MKRIGIFGGTFNPVHNGHVHLAENYIQALNLDELLVVPTQQPPHKETLDLAPAKARYKMCKMAFKKVKHAAVIDLELKRGGKSYTIDTVNEVIKTAPSASLYLLVGSDMFFSFLQWKDWQKLLSSTILCTSARNLGEYDKMVQMGKELNQYGNSPIIFDFPVLSISSTEVRERIRIGQNCSDLLNSKVYSYILAHKMYKNKGWQVDQDKMDQDYIELIRGMLKPERFIHSINVAEQAVFLARLYGEDPNKAYLAGILHDVCKNMSKQEQLQWIKKSDIILDSNMLKQPAIWHGFAGAGYIQRQLGIQDEDVVNAVRYHTVAREGMSKLEQIVYLADLTSKERNYPDVEDMRNAVEKSLESAMKKAPIFSVGSLAAEGRPICLDTCRAYNQYLNAE